MINAYGPTEATVVTSWSAPLEPGGTPPIGGPIPNTAVYVLDAALRPVHVGVPGELYAGGAGVARGYLNRPALTSARFVPDPFAPAPGARLYRTGDRVRWRADGTVEYLGRLDEQVKVRGFRIEPGEIEAALARLAGVRETVVLSRRYASGAGDQRLVAYVVAEAGKTVSPADLRMRLAAILPPYMVPSYVVPLAAGRHLVVRGDTSLQTRR